MIIFRVVLLFLLVLRTVSVCLLLLFLSMLPLEKKKKVLQVEARNTIDLILVPVTAPQTKLPPTIGQDSFF